MRDSAELEFKETRFGLLRLLNLEVIANMLAKVGLTVDETTDNIKEGLMKIVCARLAQLVRSLTANQEVPGRGLSFGRPSFATPSVDRDVKPLV